MTGQQYTVIADRARGDDPQWTDIVDGDRVLYISGSKLAMARVDRIERPAPTTDEPKRMPMTHRHDGHGPDDTCRDCESQPSPHPPTREQIADELEYRVRTAVARARAAERHGESYPREFVDQQVTDGRTRVFALIQNGAER